MMYETAGVERMDMLSRSSRNYRTLNNAELETLVDNKAHNQRADPISDLIDLKIARIKLRDRVHNTRGNHLDDMILMNEINRRIWALDKKEHIRAMCDRRFV